MHLLLRLLLRIARGERFEKSSPEVFRYSTAGFFFVTLLAAGLAYFSPDFSRADKPRSLSLYITLTLCLMAFAFIVWARYVPGKISLILAAIIWVALIILAVIHL